MKIPVTVRDLMEVLSKLNPDAPVVMQEPTDEYCGHAFCSPHPPTIRRCTASGKERYLLEAGDDDDPLVLPDQEE